MSQLCGSLFESIKSETMQHEKNEKHEIVLGLTIKYKFDYERCISIDTFFGIFVAVADHEMWFFWWNNKHTQIRPWLQSDYVSFVHTEHSDIRERDVYRLKCVCPHAMDKHNRNIWNHISARLFFVHTCSRSTINGSVVVIVCNEYRNESMVLVPNFNEEQNNKVWNNHIQNPLPSRFINREIGNGDFHMFSCWDTLNLSQIETEKNQ